MAYTTKAKELRTCRHVATDGRLCRGWAVWGDELQRCRSHGGRHPSGEPGDRTRPILCRCAAYAWPHRPGGGLCRWPDPPLYQRTTPAGTHAAYRVRPPRCLTRVGWRDESQPPVWLRT